MFFRWHKRYGFAELRTDDDATIPRVHLNYFGSRGAVDNLNLSLRSQMIDALSDDLTQVSCGQAVSNL
jgi:hypothetical protein